MNYVAAVNQGDDGRPDFHARKACNYAEQAIQVVLEFHGCCSLLYCFFATHSIDLKHTFLAISWTQGCGNLLPGACFTQEQVICEIWWDEHSLPWTKYHRLTKRRMPRLRSFWSHWSPKSRIGTLRNVLQSLCRDRDQRPDQRGTNWDQPTNQRTDQKQHSRQKTGQSWIAGGDHHPKGALQITIIFLKDSEAGEVRRPDELSHRLFPLFFLSFCHLAPHSDRRHFQKCVKLQLQRQLINVCIKYNTSIFKYTYLPARNILQINKFAENW